MKPKFILHGGGGQFETIKDLSFYRQMVNPFPQEKIKVLSVHFAMRGLSPEVRDKIAKDTQWTFEYANPHKEIQVLTTDTETFVEDISISDIIFVHGGDGDELKKVMGQFNLEEIIQDDTVYAGFSAGANIWSEFYYSNDNQAVNQGLGVLPIATFCHYATSKWYKLNQLIRAVQKHNLPVLPLSDDGYIVI